MPFTVTTASYVDIAISIQETASNVKFSTILDGFYALGPQGQRQSLINRNISTNTNAGTISGEWTFDARALPNTTWSIWAKSTISNTDNAILGSDLQIDTVTINIPNNPNIVYGLDIDFKSPSVSSLPSGWSVSNATLLFSLSGMTITGTGPLDWGTRVVESVPFTFSNGNSVEIDFVSSPNLMGVGIGKNKAAGGFGDFASTDSLMWLATSGSLSFGDSESIPNGSGEWVLGRTYRLRIKRIGSNAEVTYFKDIGSGYTQFKQVTVAIPTPLTIGTTRVLLDCSYSNELLIQRVAIAVV